MYAQVLFECELLPETLPADVTLEGPLTRVDAQVLSEMALLVEVHWTEVALASDST